MNIGSEVPMLPTVRLLSPTGTPMDGERITWTITSGGGTLGGGAVVTGNGGYSQMNWILGFTPGTQTLTASYGTAQPIVFTATGTGALGFYYPAFTHTRISTDTLDITIKVSSPRELAGVTASLEGRTATLTYVNGGYWQGKILLAGLPRGNKSVVVTGTDVAGGTGSLAVPFIYDRRPVLVVELPTPGTVANPGIRVRLTCQDDDPTPCTLFVRGPVTSSSTTPPEMARATGTLDQVFSLAEYEGREVTLQFAARDSAGREDRQERAIRVQSSNPLSPIPSGGTLTLDVDPTRVLFVDGNAGTLGIRDRSSGAVGTAPAIPGRTPGNGYLTPRGAIFFADGGGATGLYEWRDGSIVTLASSGASSLQVKGSWARWNISGSGMQLRNLDAGITTAVSGVTGTDVDLGPNGDIVFSAGDFFGSSIYRWRAGTVTELVAPQGSWPQNQAPVTDGANVVFTRFNGRSTYQVARYTPTGVEELSPPRTAVSSGTGYQVNNGWIAWTKVGNTGVQQVWTRAPDGTERQVSLFAQLSNLAALGPNGDVAFDSGGHRYLGSPPYASPARDLGFIDGYRVYFAGSELIIHIGSSAYHPN